MRGTTLGRDELERLAERARRRTPGSPEKGPVGASPRPGLHLFRQHERTAFEASILEPVLILILQGRKEMALGERTVRLAAGECAVISHDLPIATRVLEAPYLALLVAVEVDVVRGLYEDVGELPPRPAARALEVHRAEPALLDALDRYLALADASTDARVLGPMLLREIHYRLLTAPLGHMLRSLLRHDSHASAIARAIGILRRDFRAPMVVEDLARAVGMSVSSFHKHFKDVTTSSPLQYQKTLRLLEARRALLAGAESVTTVAYEVGYESPTQFAREYARKFGRPPSHDRAAAPRSSQVRR